MPSHSYLLNNFDLISLTGPDSRQFLQGQVSCNMDLLSGERSLRGALCNLKGRVVADFRIISLQGEGEREKTDNCLIQLSTGLGEKVKSILDKYAVFSKVDISLASGAYHRQGLLGEDAEDIISGLFGDCPNDADQVVISDDGFAIRLPGLHPRFEIWQARPNDTSVKQAPVFPPLAKLEQASDEEWLRQDISQGIVHIHTGISELYTPQLLNYDISGVIDFKKGCYTGQEVVARMFYRGQAKKRLFRASVENGPITPNTGVVVADDQATQEAILSYARCSHSGYEMLAILPVDCIQNERSPTLSNEPYSPLRILTLPYTE